MSPGELLVGKSFSLNKTRFRTLVLQGRCFPFSFPFHANTRASSEFCKNRELSLCEASYRLPVLVWGPFLFSSPVLLSSRRRASHCSFTASGRLRYLSISYHIISRPHVPLLRRLEYNGFQKWQNWLFYRKTLRASSPLRRAGGGLVPLIP